MAKVEDAPPELRTLARRIPPDTIRGLGRAELRVRLERADSLFSEAVYSGDREAERLRREGERILLAVPLRGYIPVGALLVNEISAAHERGDFRAEGELRDKLAAFAKQNPQPTGEDEAVMAEITGAAAKRRWFTRRTR